MPIATFIRVVTKPLKHWSEGVIQGSWLPYSTDFIFVFVSWVGGGNPPWAVPKSLRPHCDQEKQAGDNFFAKYPCHAYKYESHAKKTAPKKVKNLLKTAVSSDWQPHPGNGEQACSLPLSSSPHQPAFTGKRRRTALRLTRSLYKWDFNLLDGIFGHIAEFWPCISVYLPRMHGKKCISTPPVIRRCRIGWSGWHLFISVKHLLHHLWLVVRKASIQCNCLTCRGRSDSCYQFTQVDSGREFIWSHHLHRRQACWMRLG